MPLFGNLSFKKMTLKLLWDVFMVWVALANLSLILFDLAYLWLRPTFFHYAPVITQVYDPVKGIEPHPLTHALSEQVDLASRLLRLDPDSPRLEEHLDNLVPLTARLFAENPFERSGLTRNLEIIKMVMARELGRPLSSVNTPEQIQAMCSAYWSGSQDLLRRRLEVFQRSVTPLLEVNYYREFDLNGNLVDHFWMLDLPFLALFWIEFVVRWVLAMRRKTHARWFFFPIFNWYDLLGLIPVKQLRLFRLLRVASIYMRLRQSELSRVGKDVVSRAVAYVSNIVTEEISDMVSLRILNEYQEEIRDKTHLRIFKQTVATRREEIVRVVVNQLRDVLKNPRNQEHFRQLLKVNARTAVREGHVLKGLPIPKSLAEPVVVAATQAVVLTLVHTLRDGLESDEGNQAAQKLIASVLEQLLAGPGLAEMESLGSEITIDVIEHMKEAVAVKKWALPEQSPEPPGE